MLDFEMAAAWSCCPVFYDTNRCNQGQKRLIPLRVEEWCLNTEEPSPDLSTQEASQGVAREKSEGEQCAQREKTGVCVCVYVLH